MTEHPYVYGGLEVRLLEQFTMPPGWIQNLQKGLLLKVNHPEFYSFISLVVPQAISAAYAVLLLQT